MIQSHINHIFKFKKNLRHNFKYSNLNCTQFKYFLVTVVRVKEDKSIKGQESLNITLQINKQKKYNFFSFIG